MKMYFSKADQNDFGGVFEVNGNRFYNCVEFGSNPGGIEEVLISDSSDRAVPIYMGDLPALKAIIDDILENFDKFQKMERMVQEAERLSDELDYVYDEDVVLMYDQSICLDS